VQPQVRKAGARVHGSPWEGQAAGGTLGSREHEWAALYRLPVGAAQPGGQAGRQAGRVRRQAKKADQLREAGPADKQAGGPAHGGSRRQAGGQPAGGGQGRC